MGAIHSENEKEDEISEKEDIGMQKHIENFLALCKDQLPLKEFEAVASKIQNLKEGLSEGQEESSSLKIFLLDQTEELRKDKGHVFTHIKAVIDRINKDIEDSATIERIKKAIKGEKNDSTGKSSNIGESESEVGKNEKMEAAKDSNEANKGRYQLKKNVFFRALPESPNPPPP